MAPALFGFSGLDEIGHTFEYFICSSEVFIDEMFVVKFEKPVVQFVFFHGPVSFLDIFCLFLGHLYLRIEIPFLGFLFVFLSGESDVAFFTEE